MIVDYTDELPGQDLPIQIQATWILTLCYQAMNVAEFAAESPELQGIYSNIYLHQTLMLFTFRINLLLKQSLGEIVVLGAWSLLAYKVHFCIADVSPL